MLKHKKQRIDEREKEKKKLVHKEKQVFIHFLKNITKKIFHLN